VSDRLIVPVRYFGQRSLFFFFFFSFFFFIFDFFKGLDDRFSSLFTRTPLAYEAPPCPPAILSPAPRGFPPQFPLWIFSDLLSVTSRAAASSEPVSRLHPQSPPRQPVTYIIRPRIRTHFIRDGVDTRGGSKPKSHPLVCSENREIVRRPLFPATFSLSVNHKCSFLSSHDLFRPLPLLSVLARLSHPDCPRDFSATITFFFFFFPQRKEYQPVPDCARMLTPPAAFFFAPPGTRLLPHAFPPIALAVRRPSLYVFLRRSLSVMNSSRPPHNTCFLFLIFIVFLKFLKLCTPNFFSPPIK